MSKEESEQKRKEYFVRQGYGCLIIWGDEINDEAAIVARIKAFQET